MADVIETTAFAITAGVNLVKTIKEKFGYTAEDLAIASGLTVEELNGIETGTDTEPSKLHRIAHSVGLPDVTPQIQH